MPKTPNRPSSAPVRACWPLMSSLPLAAAMNSTTKSSQVIP